MTVLGYGAAVFLLVLLAGAVFLRFDAARIAASLRLVGPFALGAVGAGMLLLGRAGLGGMMLSGALAWYVSGRRRLAARPTPGKRSSVRTAALEMELDHDSGGLEGVVLAGPHEGEQLGQLGLEQLLELGRALASDSESTRLLETYLDSRFPVWREHAKPNMGDGEGRAPASGAMSKEEAYKVLGLEAGASTADIRKAHRRLMQRLHPDLGGTSFLAARINEAKEILLSNQR
ncbi:DnaJ domain-containing protein [Mesorhizobium sp. CAU 1732]|uniref:DnaJ domain-containing protein n=1 Tax=Mesorhizobium sp. CAU 1732 TaxID=3140358 RepID=UPI0032618665